MQTVALIIPEILPEKQSNMLEAMQRLEPWFGGGGVYGSGTGVSGWDPEICVH